MNAKVAPISATNDFVVKFANVNGSGSASANELFAKSILRMGVPVSPRNIFPSNIQGLPTWYEVRVTESGRLGRRGGVDLMVAMNPQTWNADVKEIEPGGYLFYDNSKSLPASRFRDDIHVIGVPLTEICNAAYSDPRQSQLFKNIVYVGALSVLLDIDNDVIEKLIGEQYKSKPKLLDSNVQALQFGRDYVQKNLAHPIGLRVRRANAVGDRIFVDGNSAAALGCVYGGATVCAWYPITPSSSCAEAFISYCQKLRVEPETGKNLYAIVQAEDEIASIGMVVGAGWNGARAFTATSGPGVSLMTEFLGLAYMAEIPVTIINVQRGGPSTGMPTRTQQADILSCAYASHGDTKHVLLFPEDPHECFEFAAAALDLADRLQTPIFVMSDLDIGMNQRLCAPFNWDDTRALRPRQGHDRRGTGGRQEIRPLPRRRWRRHSLSHLSGDASVQGQLFHPRHHQGRLRALLGSWPRLPLQHGTAAEEVRYRESAGAAAGDDRGREADRCGGDLFRLDQPGHERGDRGVAWQRPAPGHPSRSRLPVSRHRRRLHRRPRRCSWSSRTATPNCAACWSTNSASIRPSWLPVLHYDGTPITARFIASDIASRRRAQSRSPGRKRPPAHDLRRQAKTPSPVAVDQQGRHHPARLRRQDFHALRRMRPRFDLGGDHPGLLGARYRAASRRQAFGHRLQFEDARLFPRPVARLQHRARAHALGPDRRQPGQSRVALSGRFRRRRLAPRSASASSCTPCVVA